MNRTLLFGVSVFLALVGISLMGGSRQAVAGFGWRGCHGFHGCYGGYVSDCRGCWGRGYYVGSNCYGCHGCNGCYGCHGCNGCDGCFGCQGCHGCHGGWRVEPQAVPAVPTPPAQPGSDAPMPPAAGASSDPGSTLLNVQVPESATVFINNQPTRSTGAQRSYISRGLLPGKTYVYDVRAELMRGDERLVQTRQLRMQDGQRADVEFRFGEHLTSDRPTTGSPGTARTHRDLNAKVTRIE